MIRSLCLLVCLCAALAIIPACNSGKSQDPVHGQETSTEWEFPQGTLGIRVTPWEEIKNIEIADWAMKHRLSAATGEKVLNQRHEALKSRVDNAWYIARALHRRKGKKRFSILTACSYRDEGEYGRLIDAYGNLDILQKMVTV